MLLLTCLLFFSALVSVITWYGARRYARPARVFEQVAGLAPAPVPTVDQVTPDQAPLPVHVLQRIGAQIPLSPNEASRIRRDLMAAGYRSERSLYIYQGIRIVACIVLGLLAIALRAYFPANVVLSILIPVAAAFVGFMIPTLALQNTISRRHERLRAGLPDALDLMVVAVEAGIGLDEAIQVVARELAEGHPDVSQEFQVVNLEIQAGKRRAEALHNLGERTGEPEIRKLVAIMVQTDRFGTSIADSLRVHSDFMRTKRRQDAEERAGKVGVKLVFPIFFLILPAMLVVAAGPGILQVFRYLFPMMRHFTPPGG